MQGFDCFVQSIALGDHVSDAVRSDPELVDLITDVVIELYLYDIRTLRIFVYL